jgi:hypothetical protein
MPERQGIPVVGTFFISNPQSNTGRIAPRPLRMMQMATAVSPGFPVPMRLCGTSDASLPSSIAEQELSRRRLRKDGKIALRKLGVFRKGEHKSITVTLAEIPK